MNLKQELIDRLDVPENWDKYDYQTQRYSFDDMQEVLEDIFKKLTMSGVVVPKGTLCQHDRSVTNRVCDDCGNVITYVPDEDLA